MDRQIRSCTGIRSSKTWTRYKKYCLQPSQESQDLNGPCQGVDDKVGARPTLGMTRMPRFVHTHGTFLRQPLNYSRVVNNSARDVSHFAMDSALAALPAILICTFGYLLLKNRRKEHPPFAPGPPANLLVGNILQLPPSAAWHKSMEWKAKYGLSNRLHLMIMQPSFPSGRRSRLSSCPRENCSDREWSFLCE